MKVVVIGILSLFVVQTYGFELSESSLKRAVEITKKMSLRDKIGQMTQAERQHATPEEVKKYGLGSILSGGGSNPTPNTPEAWKKMVKNYYDYSLQSRSGVPLIYGVDAVHGHNNVLGATIFPHNIGLGVANDLDLTKKMGEVVAEELKATGIYWNFAPTTAIADDQRWGRFYESFGDDAEIVTALSMAYMEGLQNAGVLATPKHFLGDGGTAHGHDRGDTRLNEEEIRETHLKPYIAAVKQGAQSIMISFSSINGEKMHGHHYWITKVLKGELNFQGFTVSDWNGIEELEGTYRDQVKKSVLAGIDLFMVPERWKEFMSTLEELVLSGEVPMARIDDAVTRIIAVKDAMGLFNIDFKTKHLFGARAHREVADQLAVKSLKIMKNENVLPLKKKRILLTGKAAINTGYQCGGWTIEWQGVEKNVPGATSLYEALKSNGVQVTYVKPEKISSINPADFDVAIAAIGERPYTEMMGDIVMGEYPYPDRTPYGYTLDYYALHPKDESVVKELKKRNLPIMSFVFSGRTLEMTELKNDSNALVLSWLPGSELNLIAKKLIEEGRF